MKVNRKDFIKQISADTGYAIVDITEVFDSLERNMIKNLKEQNTVKLCKGVTFGSKLVESKTSYDPRNRKAITIPSKIKCNVKFSKVFKDSVNEK